MGFQPQAYGIVRADIKRVREIFKGDYYSPTLHSLCDELEARMQMLPEDGVVGPRLAAGVRAAEAFLATDESDLEVLVRLVVNAVRADPNETTL